MNASALKHVDAKTLKSWIDADKAVLIDIREPDEYAREHIPAARLVPLSDLSADKFSSDRDRIGVFHCRSGSRTDLAEAYILGCGFREVYHLKGGLEGWKAAGLDVTVNRKVPISIMRQVQITAGSLVVLGIVLAVLVSPWFMALSAFVGAGLAFAGASGTCAMASMLKYMPWNRVLAAPGAGAPAETPAV